MGKARFYVVWKGNIPGIYKSWNDCKNQIDGFENALYKSFSSMAEAERAFNSSPFDFFGKKESKTPKSIDNNQPSHTHTVAMAVDAACSGNPGKMEYRGVYLVNREEVFHFGPIYGTNNVGEFLAIVHALALLKKKENNMPIYSDSVNAMLWIKQKKCKTKLPRTAKSEELFNMIERAELWLKNNSYNNPIIKWQTENWGEIPADFGRK